ncbi:hypothetical protein LCGC14_2448410, partial [marine sediment metagenome]
LVDAPSGTSIQSVLGISSTQVTIDLAFDSTDFDVDSTNFRVDIDSSVLIQTETEYLRTNRRTVFAYLENPVATMSSDSVLHELTLDIRTLTIDLTEEEFTSHSTLDKDNDFVLNNVPTGTSIESIQSSSPTQVVLNLAFDGTEYDNNIPNFSVGIDHSVLLQTESEYLVTSTLNIFAFLEVPQATLTGDSILTEQRIDFRTLTINLTQEEFNDYTSLDTSDFSLYNAPSGLAIDSISSSVETQVIIYLGYTGLDFDTIFTIFAVDLLDDSDQLLQTTGGFLRTSSLNIQPFIENPVGILSADSTLREQRLDFRTLFVNLTQERFYNHLTLNAADFSISGAPPGTAIESVTGNSLTQATIELAYTGIDFDVDSTNFTVNIDQSVLVQTQADSLISTALTIQAYRENPIATLTEDILLTEQNLDLRTLSVVLTEEEFVHYDTLKTTDFSLAFAPAGLTIEAVNGISPTMADIELAFDATDFDEDFTSMVLLILKDVLIQTEIPSLFSSSVNVTAYVETA